MGIVCDVRRYEECSAVVTAVENRWGPVDTLVATVGIIRHCPIEEMSEKDWQNVLDINLTGVYHAVKSVVPSMKSRKYGHIVVPPLADGPGERWASTMPPPKPASMAW